jgi:arabinose-5-phosphate isomerase
MIDQDVLEKEWLAAARLAMQVEARAIGAAAERLDGSLCQAVRLILKHQGKVVVTGTGKSGHIGKKIAATFSSTGTPAVYLHPTEAVHGDLGLCAPGDPVIMLSKSGATKELVRLVPEFRVLEAPLIGILGNATSPLAAAVDVVLDASVDREADPANLAPTASAAVALALGDALAVALMKARNFSSEDFHRRHPGGSLGTGLQLKVAQAMHGSGETACVAPRDSLRQVVIAMTLHPLGAACVLHPDGRFAGLVTDGDLRRALEKHEDIRILRALDVMTTGAVTIGPDERLLDALRLMEDRPSQISVLPVVRPRDGGFLGLLRLHDIYRASLGPGGGTPRTR